MPGSTPLPVVDSVIDLMSPNRTKQELVKLISMLVKVPVYFNVEVDKNAKVTDVSLYTEHLKNLLEEYLADSSFKLEGSWWDDNRIKANFVTSREALDSLRTKK